jgi:antitoxin (DNA-binding transcriptional repressor) of toxin-antitoxin stability system
MIHTTFSDAPKLAELVDAALRGEEVIIATDDEDSERVIQLVVTTKNHPWGIPKAGSAKGWFILTDAFDEPLEDFEEYMR